MLQAIGTGDLAWQPREVKRGELGSAVKKMGSWSPRYTQIIFQGLNFINGDLIGGAFFFIGMKLHGETLSHELEIWLVMMN